MHGERRVLFTGDRPNGPMHIGHYVGSIRNRLALQGRHDQYVMIADHLALTDNIDNPADIARNVVQIGLDYLATGIDPARTTIFVQSRVEALAALTTLYLNLVPAGSLLANPSRNEEVARRGFGDDAPAGMFTYTVSQVADITAFDADGVPVGADQVPLVEFAADVAQRFNARFGRPGEPVLVVPEPISPDMGRLPGIDGRPKMGKSLRNAIYLSDHPDVVTEKIMRIALHPHGADPDAGVDPATCPPFVYLREFHPEPADVAELAAAYRDGRIDDTELRLILLDVMQEFLAPIRKRRAEFDADQAEVLHILRAGSERAATKANTTLDRARKAMGLHYF
jgi:tryptophanyl-tRNA synthetase